VYYDCMAAEGLYCETKTYDGWCEMWGTPLHLAASNDSKCSYPRGLMST
jgi:hypothetical protein